MDTRAISRCFFPPDHQVQSDVAIVFGMSNPQRPVSCAIGLFHAGMARRLLFTGGFNRQLGSVEAHEMERIALQGGIPPEAILIEDQARNTEENVRFSYRLLENQVGLDGISTITLVTIHYHLRRAYIAARRWFPAKAHLCWTSYASLHYTSENWFEVERGRRDVVSELDKIQRYYGLGPDTEWKDL